MNRYSDLTKDELLEKEEDWWEREDESDLNWIMEGVRLYKLLSRIDLREISYREMLAYLLLKQGEDMKLRQHSYETAIPTFNQVVRLDPTNSIAYYRLGFLHFYQENWAYSIHTFQQSIHNKARLPKNRLNKEQIVKAHYYILKSAQIISNTTLNKVEALPEKDLELFGEISQLITERKEGIGTAAEKPYQMIVNGKEFHNLSEREYEKLSDSEENAEYIILNQRTIHDTWLSLNRKVITIPAKQVPLLEFIMRHPEGVSRSDIIERKYHESSSPENTLTQNISRLRRRLRELDPSLEFIETIEGGYRWNGDNEFRMFKHNRDVSTDLLLD